MWIKQERVNPGGSIKDRIALAMIEDAEASGALKPGGTIVEPTSGNTGIGLALVAAVKGYKLILVMPDSMSIERRRLMLAYGASFDLTPREKGMKGAIARAEEIVAADRRRVDAAAVREPIQPRRSTAAPRSQEIRRDFADSPPDAIITGVGTGGHIQAIAEELKKDWPKLKVFAVEPTLSPVLSGGDPRPTRSRALARASSPPCSTPICSTGSSRSIPPTPRRWPAAAPARKGVLVGISSGATLAAIAQKLPELGDNPRVLGFNYDTGERYLSVPDFLPE